MIKKYFTIVVAEDDDIDAKALMRSFDKSGAKNPIYRAKNGIEALKMLKEKSNGHALEPYILLADINMPMMSGIELIRKIRKDENLHRAIIFVLTTSNSSVDKIAAYSLNVAGYILKENVGKNFEKLIELLSCYSEVIEFP